MSAQLIESDGSPRAKRPRTELDLSADVDSDLEDLLEADSEGEAEGLGTGTQGI